MNILVNVDFTICWCLNVMQDTTTPNHLSNIISSYDMLNMELHENIFLTKDVSRNNGFKRDETNVCNTFVNISF